MIIARRVFALASTMALGATAGCALDTEALGTVQQQTGCPFDWCGANDSEAKALSAHAAGLANHVSYVVTGVQLPNGVPVQLRTKNSDLSAHVLGSKAVLGGSDLVGTTMTMSLGNGTDVILTIAGRTQNGVESWAFPNEYHPTYDVTWRYDDEDPSTSRSLCGASPWSDQDTLAPTTTEVLILPREAYDWAGNPTNDLADDPSDGEGWLSFACSGGAVAKKKLMGYDLDFTGERATTRAESHTAINMLNARYCGGESHTFAGTRLWWQNDREWFDLSGYGSMVIEAIWGIDGKAVCLNTPRVVDRTTAMQGCTEPLPTCEGYDWQSYPLTSFIPLD